MLRVMFMSVALNTGGRSPQSMFMGVVLLTIYL